MVRIIKWALVGICVAFWFALVMLLPAGLLLWIVYPWGWKMALAGLPFFVIASGLAKWKQ